MKTKTIRVLNRRTKNNKRIENKYINITIDTFPSGSVSYTINGFLYSEQIKALKPFNIMQLSRGGINIY